MASAYLSKTSGTTTNNKIGTFSAWIKFSKKTETSSYEPHIFDSYSSSDNRSGLKFEAQKLLFYSRVGASTQVNVSFISSTILMKSAIPDFSFSLVKSV